MTALNKQALREAVFLRTVTHHRPEDYGIITRGILRRVSQIPGKDRSGVMGALLLLRLPSMVFARWVKICCHTSVRAMTPLARSLIVGHPPKMETIQMLIFRRCVGPWG